MSTPAIPEQIKKLIKEKYRQGMAMSKIAKELGLSQGAVFNHIDDEDRQAHEEALTLTRENVIEKLREEKRRATERKEHVDAVKELALRDWLEEQLNRLVPSLPAPPKYKETKRKNSKPTTITPILHFSDWHYGEVVGKDKVLGLNEYNARIASQRVYRVTHAFLADLEDMRAGGRYQYDKLIIALNGDMLTGVIHDLENEAEANNICEATVQCGLLIAQCVRDLAAKFSKVEVKCTVGNHGRLPDDKKMPMKQASRSFDWLAYAYAQTACRDMDHVTWDLPNAYAVEYKIGNYRVFQGHGNFIKQQLNTPAYGMRRFVSGMQAARAKAGASVDLVLFGHWHAGAKMEHAGCITLVNPSLIGTQETTFHWYGSISIPAQDCYLVDPDLGYVGQKVFYGEGAGYHGEYDLGL